MANLRGASAAVQAAAAAAACQPVHLFELYLAGGDTYGSDASIPITWGGRTYTALGHLLKFDGIEESAALEVTQLRVQLSGVDQAIIAQVLQYAYIDRRIVIRKAFLDGAGGVLVDPIAIFDGRCDAPVIEEDPDSGQCSISLAASAQWIDFERRPGRHTNHDEQQIWFPGDRGFEFISQLGREIKWGAP